MKEGDPEKLHQASSLFLNYKITDLANVKAV